MLHILFKFLLFLLIWGYSSVYAQQTKTTFKPDTTINKTLMLLNSISMVHVLGDQRNKMIEDSGPSRVLYKNKLSNQYLIIYHCNGLNINTFNLFEVGLLTSNKQQYYQSKIQAFKTENNIALNMSLDSFLKTKGKPTKTYKEGKYYVVEYELREKNKLLTRYNMPIYEAKYFFIKKKLIKFIFGFPNL